MRGVHKTKQKWSILGLVFCYSLDNHAKIWINSKSLFNNPGEYTGDKSTQQLHNNTNKTEQRAEGTKGLNTQGVIKGKQSRCGIKLTTMGIN